MRIFPTKRPGASTFRRAFALGLTAVLVSIQAPALALNAPQPKLLYPGDGDSRKSQDVPIVYIRFDRPLKHAKFQLKDSSNATVPGIMRLNEPDHEHESYRMIEFIPTNPLSETVSPYIATALGCAQPAGDCTEISWDFEIDDTDPATPSISSPLNNSIVTSQVVTVRGNAEPGAYIWVFEVPDMQNQIAMDRADESGNYTVQLPYPPEDGVEHRIRVAAVDRAGNISNLTPIRRFIHDAVYMLPIITLPVEGAFLASTSVTVEGRAKAGSTARIYEGAALRGTTTVGADQRFSRVVTLGNGTRTLTVTADDGVFVDGPSPAVTFVVDTVAPPAPVILSPTSGSSVMGPAFVVTGTGEAYGTVRIRDAGNIVATAPVLPNGTWSLSMERPDGPVSLTAEIMDRAGNVGPQAATSFTVDSVAPVAPIILTPSDGSYHSTSTVIIGGVAEANATVAILNSGSVIATATANGSGNFSTSVTLLDGIYTVFARAIDGAGNVSGDSELVSFGIDTVAPAAPVIAQPFGGDTFGRVPIHASGTAEPGSGVTLYEGATVLGTATSSTEGSWSMTISVASGVHSIHATATDRSLNVSPASPTVSFTYDPGAPDTTPPGAPIISRPLQNEIVQPVVLIRGTAEPLSRVAITEGPTVLTTANADEAGEWGTTLVLTAGAHAITARGTDRAGNVGPVSAIRNFVVDSQRPTVTITSGIVDPTNTFEDLIVLLPNAGPDSITGTAEDDTQVERIEFETVDRRTNERLGPFDAICLACPASAVAWNSGVSVPPGLYRLEAYAVDAAGRRSLPDTRLMLVLDP